MNVTDYSKRAGDHPGLLILCQKYSHLNPSSWIPCLDAEEASTSNINEVEVEGEKRQLSIYTDWVLIFLSLDDWGSLPCDHIYYQ